MPREHCTPITWQATVFAISAETGITHRNVFKKIDYQSFQEIELVCVDAREISTGTREGGGHSDARWIELSINQRVLRFVWPKRHRGNTNPRFWTFLHSLYARARLNGNLELSRRINIVRHSRRAEITTLHEVSWMCPRASFQSAHGA
jgi:hypothetical protein